MIFSQEDYTNDEIKNGILYYNNGDYYEGEFQNGKKEGFGIIIYKNGTQYEGIFKNNKHNGVIGKMGKLMEKEFVIIQMVIDILFIY